MSSSSILEAAASKPVSPTDSLLARRPKPKSERQQYVSATRAVWHRTKHLFHRVVYHAYTIWLFTESDLSTSCVQGVVFGLAGAASGRLTFSPDSRASTPFSPGEVLASLPPVFAFLWLHLLLFQLLNQSIPGAAAEDAANKPWRPVAAGRITERTVRRVLFPAVLVATLLLSRLWWGAAHLVLPETPLFLLLSYVNNDLAYSETVVPRNILAALGLSVLNAGALRLSARSVGEWVGGAGYAWVAVVGAVIASTLHMQDMKDQVGDAARGRHTVPLVLGDAAARWSIAVPVAFWAVMCPWMCSGGIVGYSLSILSATVAVARLPLWRGRASDALTWKLWTLWLGIIYIMPFLALL